MGQGCCVGCCGWLEIHPSQGGPEPGRRPATSSVGASRRRALGCRGRSEWTDVGTGDQAHARAPKNREARPALGCSSLRGRRRRRRALPEEGTEDPRSCAGAFTCVRAGSGPQRMRGFPRVIRSPGTRDRRAEAEVSAASDPASPDLGPRTVGVMQGLRGEEGPHQNSDVLTFHSPPQRRNPSTGETAPLFKQIH